MASISVIVEFRLFKLWRYGLFFLGFLQMKIANRKSWHLWYTHKGQIVFKELLKKRVCHHVS